MVEHAGRFTLLPVGLNVIWVFFIVMVALTGMLLVFPRAPQADPILEQPKQELWLRMATASVMVVTLTGVARMLGPMRRGILSAFPAYTTILAVFSHRYGPSSAVKVLKGVTVGLYTAATFFLVLSLSLAHLRGAWSFALAVAAGLAVQAGSFIYVRRSPALTRW